MREKTIDFSMLHRHLVFSFVYWYNRQVLLLLMFIGTVLLFVLVYIPGTSILLIWGHVHSCTVHCCIYICV